MKFQELNPNIQEKLLSLGTAYYFLKGQDPQEKIGKMMTKDKKGKTWRSKKWWFMKGIDNHREKLGLDKLYS